MIIIITVITFILISHYVLKGENHIEKAIPTILIFVSTHSWCLRK